MNLLATIQGLTVAELIGGALVLNTWALAPYLAAPASDSGFWYRALYGVSNRLAGNYGQATNSVAPGVREAVFVGQTAHATVTTTGGVAETLAERAEVAAEVVSGESEVTAVKVRP